MPKKRTAAAFEASAGKLTREPALTLAGIVIRQQVRDAGVPAEAKSIAELDADARIFGNIANVAGIHAMLSDEPELLANTSVTHRGAARLAGLAADGFQERATRRNNSQGKRKLDGRVENKLLHQRNDLALHRCREALRQALS